MTPIVIRGKRAKGQSSSGQLQLADPVTLTVKGKRMLTKMVRLPNAEVIIPPSVAKQWQEQGYVQ